MHGSVHGGPWQDIPMQEVTAAAGQLLYADVVQNDRNKNSSVSGSHLLEFVITDRLGSWEKPSYGGNFVITGPGRYKVEGGAIQTVSGPAIMVVSDLDGTMVGDDVATAAFREFWVSTGAVRGGVLVYNTGRSLQSFEQLLKDKAHCMAAPDALISAVGTKVYQRQLLPGSSTKGGEWEEDAEWSKQLDEGWDVQAVREAGYKALSQVGKDAMHFRPPEEQNIHKVTCGVNVSVLDSVLACIKDSLATSSVKANVITSGHGEWRYLDLVPMKAGKLEALEYVRKLHNFPISSTVACGDSGNDILMLAGKNPAIVVGNAQPDLMQWVQEQQKQSVESRGNSNDVRRLFVASKPEALGILEGLKAHGFV
ncbi:hypothetical protein CEUSTIGMA_g9784.t1 [Chlamydomonas eustigma]|uniref:Sucrose phosphatase-like domain-containing protein n=1 Tax=Chlamydomonas eustigma TaxID=1157962 RepID=A0A250XGZ8_9CHLO|nr:hypothetical protein CEUSTIGMA_g9784.t1 [Chlamydomonas eustigma]|eukprot:GAX82355.1 hypothetical protein CEUSTIGMA_g9784.t1 [Chlamydomonas eustigma]